MSPSQRDISESGTSKTVFQDNIQDTLSCLINQKRHEVAQVKYTDMWDNQWLKSQKTDFECFFEFDKTLLKWNFSVSVFVLFQFDFLWHYTLDFPEEGCQP